MPSTPLSLIAFSMATRTVETVEEDRPLVPGDWAEIEFKGEMKSPSQEAGEGAQLLEDQAEPIVGSDVLIEVGGTNTLPAFNEALTGAKPGQEMSFEVEYPAEFGEPRLAGKNCRLRRNRQSHQA